MMNMMNKKGFLNFKYVCSIELAIRAKRSEEEERCPSAISRGHICTVCDVKAQEPFIHVSARGPCLNGINSFQTSTGIDGHTCVYAGERHNLRKQQHRIFSND